MNISDFLDAVKTNNKKSIGLFLSESGWKAGKTYDCSNSGHKEFPTQTYVGLHEIAARCGNTDLLFSAIASGSVFFDHAPTFLHTLIKSNITCEKVWTLYIERFKRKFSSSVDMCVSIAKHAVDNELNFIFEALENAIGLVELPLSKFNDDQIDSVKKLYDKGTVKAEFFYGDISNIANSWVEHKFNSALKMSDIKASFSEELLRQYTQDEVNIHTVTGLTSDEFLSYYTVIELLKIKALKNCNFSFSGDVYTFVGLSDSQISFLIDYVTIPISNSTMISLLREIDNQATVDKLLENQIKIGNIKLIKDSLRELASCYSDDLLKVISFIGRNSNKSPYLATLLNFSWYCDISIKNGSIKNIEKVDWKGVAEHFYEKPQSLFLNSDGNIKEMVALLMKEYPSIKPVMMAFLIKKHSLEAVCSVLTNKEQYKILLLLHSPMEVMPFLSIRGQKYILNSVT